VISDLNNQAMDCKRARWNMTRLNSSVRMVALACLVGILCYASAELGEALVIHIPQTAWPLWPGCAVLVGVLLVLPRNTWPILLPAGLAGFILYDLRVGVSIPSIAWLILADTLEILVAAWGVSYALNGLPRLNSLKALAKYSFFTVFLASLIVSAIGVRGLEGDDWINWRISFLSEALAFLTVTPAILGWAAQIRARKKVSREQFLEAIALVTGLVALSSVMFLVRGITVPSTLLYALVPFLLWAALRFGSTGVGTSATIVALLSILGAVHGSGPFTETDPMSRILSLQLFLLFASVPFMVLAVLVEDHTNSESEIRESEKRLRLAMEARLRLASLVESSEDAIFGKSIDGIITDWNKGAEQLYGYAASEVIGRPVSLLMSPERADDLAKIMVMLKVGESLKNHETLGLRKDGKIVPISLTVSPVKDLDGTIVGASTIARDISERKRQEAILRESEERFRLMADTAPTLIWMSGTDKLCTFFNQTWLHFTGRSMELEMGQGWVEGVHPDDMERCLATYYSAFDSHVDFEMEYRLRRFDGDYRWVVDFGVPRFEPGGNFCGYIGSCIDITERKSSEKSLHELSGRLISAQEEERARIARELHDDFSQRLALLGIGLGQLWKKLPIEEVEERASVLDMLKGTKEMSVDIHSLSHQLHSSKLEHVGLVPALRGLCKDISKKYGIEVHFSERELPPSIPKDVALCLFRVAQESLGNTVKHSKAPDARVDLGANEKGVTLSVLDTGKGFDTSVHNPAAGIGLIGMRERLRLVGGKLLVKSAPGRGTEIIAEVPLDTSANKNLAKAQAAGR
jgi:PAS domain S-box-containing protein